jgi:hypothetical protein
VLSVTSDLDRLTKASKETPDERRPGFFHASPSALRAAALSKRHLAAELRRDHRRRDTRENHDNFLKRLFTQLIRSCTVFLKVADENGFTAAGLEETTPLFAKPPENHRQCPAGGFSFWPRPTAFAADARLLRFAPIATESVSRKSQ